MGAIRLYRPDNRPEVRLLLARRGEYMEQKPVSIAAKKRDSTIYIVEYTISDNAKESAYEKVKRLILKDTKSYLEKSA